MCTHAALIQISATMAGYTDLSCIHGYGSLLTSLPCRRKLGHRCIPDLACTQPAQEIHTASRKIDLLSKIALLCFTRSCCFVVYLSVATALICTGSVKHVSAAMPAFPKPGTQALGCKIVGERKEVRLLPQGDGKSRPVHCGA